MGVWLMPGKPIHRAFNAHLQQECLNQHWSLAFAKVYAKIEQWRGLYNFECPHIRLRFGTPEEFAETHQNGAEMQGQFSQNFAETLA